MSYRTIQKQPLKGLSKSVVPQFNRNMERELKI